MKNIEFKKIALENGETYSYRECKGGEKVIIMIHGNLASSKFFDELIQGISDDYTVYAMDMRGFGESTYNRPIDTLRDFAGDLKMFVDELGLKKFDLLGWSTGGAVSMLFTISYGYMVNRLLLIAPAGVAGYHSYAIDDKGNKIQVTSREEFHNDPTKLALLNALENNDKQYYKNIWSLGIYNKKKPSDELFDIHMNESLLQRNLMDVYYGLAKFNISDRYNGLGRGTEEAHRIDVPTIIVQGDSDLLVSIKDAHELRESIGANAKVIEIKECGHSPFIDGLEVLIDVIDID